MKFSELWLREWVDPPLDTAGLCERLTMAGLEVEAVTPVAPEFSGVVVGRVLEVAPHPRADRLRLCRVDVGTGEPLPIVCGAANVRVDMRAPVACVGARLPDGTRIRPARLRGEESRGMLCSAAELGLAENAGGLLELPGDAEPGRDIRDYLQLDDCSIELSLTPNRSDCLGIAGVAREVGVITRCEVQAVDTAAVAPSCDARLPVDVSAPAACPRYLGRVLRGVDTAAGTPLWMRERLRRSGLRSIDPVVDVTNYVMLELGQPMHAFDLARIRGGIEVRLARPGEQLVLLDGQRIELEEDVLVIADQERPLALAGIMGGVDSGVSADTRDIFLESAFFSPDAIAGRARRYGLHTDSSHRFERGVDPRLAARAMERATALLREIVGGEPGPVMEACHEESLPRRAAIRLRGDRIRRLLGMTVPEEEVGDILRRLDCRVSGGDGEWQVTPPSARFDLAIEADLVEEVARVRGYDSLPTRRPLGALAIEARPVVQARRHRAALCLVDRGYREAVTYSFVSAELQGLFDPDTPPIVLANPISRDTAVMRTSLWPGLVQTIIHNLNRQQKRVRIFELGCKYFKQQDEIHEEFVIAGAATGKAWPEQWGLPARELDFYDVKGDIEALLQATGAGTIRFSACKHPALHPGQSAALLDEEGNRRGWLGLLHPRLARELALEQKVLVFELSSNIIAGGGIPGFRELSRFPAIRRDLAVVVPETVEAQAVTDCVREAAGTRLQDLRLFDIYRGKGIESGKKSIALGLILQDPERTLTDEEADALVAGVLRLLGERLGASLRD
ncbi:MAG TPA: phenylalanine--tRNA ligase subunit beta [Gammaproteobacteria bacterium]|nr:phenylalanine--tRNA ligase subunit beta [Gammaproteobacteria bacterium]